MPEIRTEILIIGGGPAGSMAARFLAREGRDTLLVERNLSFVKPCGGGVPSVAFGELGLPVPPRTRYVDRLKIISPRDEVVTIGLEGASLAIVPRRYFDNALREEAKKYGARIVEAEFRYFVDAAKTVISEVSLKGKNVRVKSDYVIAADGVNSRARAALGIRPVISFLTITEKMREVETDCCEFWFGSSHAPGLYSWVFPWEAGVSAGTGSVNGRQIKTVWQRFIERRALKRNGIRSVKDEASLRGYPIPHWQGELFGKGRILFVGDAAGQVLPLTYEGIYYAMKAGELAAEAIMEGNEKQYRRLWEKNFGKRFSLMKRLWEYFLKDDFRAERLVRFLGMPEAQAASMRLWLRKDLGKGSLLSYMHLFRRFAG